MKKLIEDFYFKRPIWMIFIANTILISIVMFLMNCFLPDILETDKSVENFYKTHIFRCIILSILEGCLFSMLFTYFHSQQLKNIKFWDVAREIENKMNETTNLVDIKTILDIDIEKLKQLSLGGAHYYEIKRLNDLLTMKINMLK